MVMPASSSVLATVSMPLMSEVVYSLTFDKLVDLCIEHLAPFSSEKQVIQRILDTIERLEKVVGDNPQSMHVSPHLASLGVRQYREFTANGFRILYRYDSDQNKVLAVVFCSQKQDLAALLVDYCLIHK